MTVDELVKALAEFVSREKTDATEPFTGNPSWIVVGAWELLDELHRLTGISKEQLGQWSDTADEKASDATRSPRP